MKGLVLAAILLCGCNGGPPAAATVRIGEDACAQCRMTIVSVKTAAQIVAPGSEPVFFDDLRCLADYRARTTLGAGAVVFVADHDTGEWIDEREAVIARADERTPMGSGLIATRRAHRRNDP